MKVFIQSVNFKADASLVEFVEKKLNSIEKYYDKIVDAEVYLKVQQTSEKENKLVDVKLNVPGNDFVVKKQCKTFEEGVMLAADTLKRQLTKKKEKVKAK
ncbi:ribosome-associated translation inhibitor RaiA [Lutibacter sp. TH_r2]|uniref:ribosome hibernation-promoting factor, HPF/YfiA family n=1 Tax=Lutibacter sp. TH_r2 TaxID=3082083 RepID=UPI00295451F5|nr:ribosome-associated translation inhibitor RaiA [Lutibacter sp. TH_r2]MDV7187226.1 ribosome-associated translation inhibitor RaiA [Lutibacter sp. TH_r2]